MVSYAVDGTAQYYGIFTDSVRTQGNVPFNGSCRSSRVSATDNWSVLTAFSQRDNPKVFLDHHVVEVGMISFLRMSS